MSLHTVGSRIRVLGALIFLTVAFQNCGDFKSSHSSQSDSTNSIDLTQSELLGKQAYEKNCMGCHGEIQDSILRNKTMEEITLALNKVPDMSHLRHLIDEPETLGSLALYLGLPKLCPKVERAWQASRLTSSQYFYSVKDLTGVDLNISDLPSDGLRKSIPNNLTLQFNLGTLRIYLEAIEKSENQILQAFKNQYLNCSNITDSCVRNGASELAAKAFRSQLSNEEKATVFEVYSKSKTLGASTDQSLIDLLTYVFISPRFLYPFEKVRAPGGAPEGDEIATRLALTLWSSVPDDLLRQKAARGELNNRQEIELEVQRMLADPRSERFYKVFFGSWVGLRGFLSQNYQTSSINHSYQQESLLFFADAVDSDLDPGQIVSADYSFINSTLANQYGLNVSAGNSFQRQSLSGTGRMGFLTQGSFLSNVGNATFATVYKRGNHVLRNFLCNPLPPPPAGVPTVEEQAPDVANMTEEEFAFQHRNKSSTCYACHARMDPIGLSLSMYDQFSRPKVAFEPITRSMATLPDGTVLGDVETLGDYLTRGPHLQSCFVEGLSTFVYSGYSNEDLECVPETYHNEVNQGPVSMKTWINKVLIDSLLAPK